MPVRQIYLIGYDIECPRRQATVRRQLRGHAIDGQKSVYECWLTPAELQQTLNTLRRRIDIARDRVLVLSMDARCTPLRWGAAPEFAGDQAFIVV